MSRLHHPSALLALLLAATTTACGGGSYGGSGPAQTCPVGSHEIVVGAGGGFSFAPPALAGVHPGDTVCWSWAAGGHDVTSGTGCVADGAYASGLRASGAIFTHVFATAGTFSYFCTPHCGLGMTGTVTVAP